MWLASKGDGNATLLFGKGLIALLLFWLQKERERRKHKQLKKKKGKRKSETKKIGEREKQRQICFSELFHFSVEPDLLQVSRRGYTIQ